MLIFIWLLLLLYASAMPFGPSEAPNLKLSTENVPLRLPFNCLPYPEDPSSVTEPFYSLCLKFSPLSPGFFSPTYIPAFPKGTTNFSINCATQFNTIFPALNFTLSFIIPQSVRGLTIAGLFAMTDTKTGLPYEDGIQLTEAMRCAITNINADPDILPHTQLNFQMWDTHGQPSSAINSAYLAIQTNVSAFVGLGSYEEVFSTAPLLNPSLLTIVSGMASSTFLDNQYLFPSFYRTVPGDKFVAVSMLNLFHSLGWNQFAVVYGNDFVGSSGLDAIGYAMTFAYGYGYSPYLLCEAMLSPTEISHVSNDVEGFINCIRVTKVRAIIIWTDPVDAASIIAKIVNAGPDVFTQDTLFFAPFSWGGSDTSIDVLNVLSNGTITPNVMYGSYSFQPRSFSQTVVKECMAQQSPKSNFNVGFLRYWQIKFRCTLKGSPLFSVRDYFNYLIVSGFFQSNSNLFSNFNFSVVDSLNETSLRSIYASLANVTRNTDVKPPFYDFFLDKIYMFTTAGDETTRDLTLCPAEGKRNPLTDLCSCPETDVLMDNSEMNPYVNYIYDATYAIALAFDQLIAPCKTTEPCDLPYFTNSDVLEALNETSFDGLTGRVSWYGHDRNRSDISLYQFCSNGSKYLVGLSNFSGLYLFTDQLCYRTQYTPMSVIVPEVANFSSIIGMVMGILFVVWIIICVLLMVFFYTKRKTEPVVSTGLAYLMFLFTGSIVISISAILWTLDSTSFLCMAKLVVLAAGFSLMFGAISAKLFRSFEVYCSLREYRVGIDTSILFIFSGTILALNLVLLVLLVLVAGKLVPTLQRESPSSLYFYITCQCTYSVDTQTVLSIFQLSVNLVLVLAALAVSLSIFTQPSPHNENTSIVAALSDLFIVSLTLVIIYFNTGTLTGTIQSQYIIRSVGTLYLLIFTLSIIIIPKLLAIFRGRSSGDPEEYGDVSPSVDPEDLNPSHSFESATRVSDAVLESSSPQGMVRNRRNRDQTRSVDFAISDSQSE